MDSFFKISESFFELTAIFKICSGVGFMHVLIDSFTYQQYYKMWPCESDFVVINQIEGKKNVLWLKTNKKRKTNKNLGVFIYLFVFIMKNMFLW